MTQWDFAGVDERQLATAAQHYEEKGYVILSGLDEAVTSHFYPLVQAAMAVEDDEFASLLDPTTPAVILPLAARERLARGHTSLPLARSILGALRPWLIRLIGPIVHISSTFHAQVKGGVTEAVDHGGYAENSDYMEVHGPYLLHQDFAGATIPTSPSMLTLWIALNDSPYWNLRLYPGSHRNGLLCDRWLELDDPRLAPLGEPIDVPARKGHAVLFNGLMLHATSNAGPWRRISCDMRVFPLCGFLPSQAHLLGPASSRALREGVERASGDVLRAPLLEDLVFLGEDPDVGDVPPLSVLNWVNYVAHVRRGDLDGAVPHLKRFANDGFGIDPSTRYVAKFHGKTLHDARFDRV